MYGYRGGTTNQTIYNTGLIAGHITDAITFEGGTNLLDNSGGELIGDVKGGNGVETLIGGNFFGDVFLYGGADVFRAQSSTQISGTVYGGEDGDDLRGGMNGDSFMGESGADFLRGGGGDDVLSGGGGADTLRGGDDHDELVGGGSGDMLYGGRGDDALSGVSGADTLKGNAGDDNLAGGSGDDTLRGGSGDDTLNGGADKDLLIGGGGADTFVFSSADHSTNDANRDEIRYFDNLDMIDLQGVFAGTLDYIGDAAFSGTGDEELRVRETASGDSIIYVDTNGDGTGDMRILVSDTLGLTDADFIL